MSLTSLCLLVLSVAGNPVEQSPQETGRGMSSEKIVLLVIMLVLFHVGAFVSHLSNI